MPNLTETQIEMAVTDVDQLLTPSSVGTSPAASLVVRAYIAAYVTIYVWPLVHVTQLMAVWITVLVAFNRYIAICRPFQAHQLCTMKQVRLQASVLGIAIVAYNIPRFFENQIEYEPYQVNYVG